MKWEGGFFTNKRVSTGYRVYFTIALCWAFGFWLRFRPWRNEGSPTCWACPDFEIEYKATLWEAELEIGLPFLRIEIFHRHAALKELEGV